MRLIALVFALSLLLAPLSAESQPAGKVYRIGMLETRSATLNAANLDAFRQGLRELGTATVRTSTSRTDRRTAATNGSRLSRASWSV